MKAMNFLEVAATVSGGGVWPRLPPKGLWIGGLWERLLERMEGVSLGWQFFLWSLETWSPQARGGPQAQVCARGQTQGRDHPPGGKAQRADP